MNHDSSDDPVVATASGLVRGRWRTRGAGGHRDAAFLSVPFAEPPVGDLRFAAPVPRRSWDGVRDARRYGPTAQIGALSAVTTIPEPSVPGDDVLTANVFTPAPGDRQARLPVLVWIHGGGFIAGSPHSSWYDGDRFTRSGVVTVSVGYRLGIEGWLHLQDAPDNRGLLDCIAGLRWVQENIEAFGGDPARVTVAGQSAGGGAVLTLLATPAARGLLARAVSFSGAVGADESADAALRTAERFTVAAGVPATTAGLAGIGREQTSRLAHELMFASGGGALFLAPFADGSVVPQPVRKAFAAGGGSDVPLLLGATSHEFVDPRARVPEDAARVVLLALGIGPQETERLLAARSGDPGLLVGQAVTDRTFRGLALDVARVRTVRGGAPTWLYEFAWTSTASRSAGLAFHCLDLPFWWDRLDGEQVLAATGPRPPRELAHDMHATFSGFVHGERPGWESFAGAHGPAMTWTLPPSTEADPYASVIGDGAADSLVDAGH